MGQTDWFIDNAGSREATGADSGHPIPELERRFRMGPRPDWSANEYHVRYLTDTAAVILEGTMRPNATIFVHGSATNGQGQSTLYSGTMNALTAQATATNQPYDVTSNGLATSWTADAGGLIGKRLRMTSGSASGAKAFSLKDLGTKKARCSDFTTVATYTGPFALPSAAATPATADTFVVERLTAIPQLIVNIPGRTAGTPAGLSNPACIVFDSLDIGSDFFYVDLASVICADGCIFECGGGNGNGLISAFKATGSLLTGLGVLPRMVRGEFYGCSALANGSNLRVFFDALSTSTVVRFISQGMAVDFIGNDANNDAGSAIITHMGVFDVSGNQAIRVKGAVNLNNPTLAIWGSGNSNAAIHIRPGGKLLYQNLGLTLSNFPISAANDVILGHSDRTTCEAFDKSLGLYTPARTLSFANILAVISAGGFCQEGFPGSPQIVDALTGAAIMPVA